MNRLRLLLLLLLVAGGLTAAWLVVLPSGPPRAPELEDSAAGLPDDAAPLSMAPQPRAGENPAGNAPTETSEGDSPEVSNPNAVAPIEEVPATEAECTEALHVPIYGTAVQSSGAVATFKLTDAREQPLHDGAADVDLWRRVGVRWIPEEAYWDSEKQVILCDGFSGKGLEPGEYELEVRTTSYGAFRHTFRISKGEQLQGTLHTPTWRRIICFEFKRPDGKPLEWIKSSPSVKTTLGKLESVERQLSPADVLRDPPKRSGGGRGGKGGFAYRRARGSGGRAWNFKTATDEGCFHVPVIAGADNLVTFDFDTVWGADELVFEGQFTGPEWDRHEVVMSPAEGFDETTAEWDQLGTDDPGHRSHLGWIERLQNPPALDDLTSFSECRLILDLEAPPGVYPLFGYQPGPEDAYQIDRQMRLRDGAYFTNASPGETVWFAFFLGDEQCGEKESVRFAAEDPERLVRLKRVVDVKTVSTPAFSFSPTLDAWATGVQAELRHWAPDGTIRGGVIELGGESYLIPPHMLTRLVDPANEGKVTLAWSIPGHGPRKFPKGVAGWRGEWDTSLQSYDSGEIGSGLCYDYFTTGAVPVPKPMGIALRVIGPELEGLPWAEASIVPYKSDAGAQRLREVEAKLHAEGKRPELGTGFADRYWSYEEEFGPDTIAATMETWVGKEFLDQTADPADLAWYADNGAWYNTRRKLKSDSLGYVWGSGFAPRPGETYVLYLWSNSRDDLKPDARIVFKAAEGCTDLGAISLPTYSD